MADLAIGELDVVFADSPAPASLSVRAFSHRLFRSEVGFFAAPRMAAKLRSRFPRTLSGAPVLIPTRNTSLRRSLDAWFETRDIRPRVVAEIEDSAILKVFGQEGVGAFAAPVVLEPQLRRQYGVRLIGVMTSVHEELFAITVERRITHPGVRAITDLARDTMIGR